MQSAGKGCNIAWPARESSSVSWSRTAFLFKDCSCPARGVFSGRSIAGTGPPAVTPFAWSRNTAGKVSYGREQGFLGRPLPGIAGCRCGEVSHPRNVFWKSILQIFSSYAARPSMGGFGASFEAEGFGQTGFSSRTLVRTPCGRNSSKLKGIGSDGSSTTMSIIIVCEISLGSFSP